MKRQRLSLFFITLIILGCSQNVDPLLAPKQASQADSDIANVAFQSLLTEVSFQDIEFERFSLLPLKEPMGPYGHLLMLSSGNLVAQVGLVNSQTEGVLWYMPSSREVEQCVLSSSVALNPMVLEGKENMEILIGSASSELEECGINFGAGQLLLMVDNTLYLSKTESPPPIDTSIATMESFKVTATDSNLMVHFDNLSHPSFAKVYAYVDERSLATDLSNPKRLLKIFSLKLMKTDQADKLFSLKSSLDNTIFNDPIQSDGSCAIVPTYFKDKTIFFSFKKTQLGEKIILGNLCGVYFAGSQRCFVAENNTGSFVSQ